MRKLITVILLFWCGIAIAQPGQTMPGNNSLRYGFNYLYRYYGGAFHLVLDKDSAATVYAPKIAPTLTNVKPATTFQSSTGTTADSLSFVSSQRHVSKAIIAGPGISVTQTSNTVTFSTAPNVVEITGTSQTATGNTIYIPHNASLTTITVPATTTIGTLYQVIGEGAGGWKVVLPSGTVAVGVGGFTTTAAGSLNSTDRYCTLTIRYAATNKSVITTSQGTITPL